MHDLMADTLDTVIGEIQRVKTEARRNGSAKRPRWPLIVLRTPKGLDAPKRLMADAPRTTGARTKCQWGRCTRTRLMCVSSKSG